MSEKTRNSPRETDEVEQAARRMRLAALDLVRLVGVERDGLNFDPRAAAALCRLGAYAVEPLAAGFKNARSPAHRCAIALLIGELATGPVAPEALDVLRRAAFNDRDPLVRKFAGHAISEILDLTFATRLERSKRHQAEATASDEAVDLPSVPAGLTPGAARLYRQLVASGDADGIVEASGAGEA